MYFNINRLKPLFLLVFVLPFLSSCGEEDIESSDQARLSNLPLGDYFQPQIKVVKGNYSVNVQIIDPRPFTSYTKVPTDPDYYEIFYSDDPNNLESLGKYDYPQSEVLLDDLVNGTPLYFTVSTNQEGFRPLFSDTVMVIPSKIQVFEDLFPNYSYPIDGYAVSQNLDYLAFSSYDFINEVYGTSFLYYINTTTDELEVLEENATSVSWANQTNQFAYVSTSKVGSVRNSVRISVFNPETQDSTVLLDVENEGLNIYNPVFSPDDKFIAYMSNENSTESYNYNVWILDLETKEKRQITDFEPMNFNCYGYLDWSPDGQSVYVTGYQFPTNVYGSIYNVDLNSGQLTAVIKTRWENSGAAISPGNSKLAFWSRRTGDWELWMQDMVTGDLSQVTGGSTSYFFSRSDITWLSDNELAIEGFGSGGTRVVKTWF